MEQLLEIKHLSVTYQTQEGAVQAVRDVSFHIGTGKTVALVGESGCGKSVTAGSIMGLVHKPGVIGKESRILYKGRNLIGNSEKEWNVFRGNECAMIFQDASVALNPTMTIGAQVSEPLENHAHKLLKSQRYDMVRDILKLVEISDVDRCLKKYPHELSGGMKQRVVIAMAMIMRPKLLIADEPTTALDVTIQAQIMDLMKDLQDKMNMSILLITHDFGIVADIADEILVMYAGKIVESGSFSDIFYHPKHPYTWALLNSVPRLDQEGKSPLITIEGNIPDMMKPPMGCAFYDRCPYAMNICKENEPFAEIYREGHVVSCWLMDARADRAGVPFEREEM